MGRVSAVSRWGVVAIHALAAVAWWLIFRHWMIQGDDFISATIGGAEGGRFTFQAWAADSWRDYWQATGRQAGSLFRIFLRGGEETIRWVMPLQQVIVAIALLLWSRSRATAWPIRWGFALAACAAVPLLAWRTPSLHGAALGWAQASFDYVVSPMLCLVVVGWVATATLSGQQWSLPRTLATAALAAIAPVLHETGSLATLAAVIVLWVIATTTRRWPRGRVRAVMIVAVVSSLVQATSPGMWKRLGVVTDDQPAESGGRLMLLRAANAAWQAGEAIGPVVLLASALLVVAALLTPGVVGGRRVRWQTGATALTHVVAMTALVVGQHHWQAWPGLHAYGEAMTAGQLRWAALVTLAAVVAALTALGLAIVPLLRAGAAADRAVSTPDALAALPAVALAGAAGSFVAPVLGGITATRAMVPLALWLIALSMAIVGGFASAETAAGNAAARRLSGAKRWVATALLIAVAATSAWAVPHWWWRTFTGLRANEATHAPVLRQLAEAKNGQRREVVFPRRYPHPELMYYYAFRLDRYEPMIRAYYEVPDDVGFVRR